MLQLINNKTDGELSRFLVEFDLCPVCAENGQISQLKLMEEGKVCTECGFTIEELNARNSIPFGNYQKPENQLAWGRGLGNTLGRKGLFCVLARGNGGKLDLPLRAKQVSVITQKLDHPRIATLLRHGRKLCHEFGFDNHKERKSVNFSNELGRMLRKIGSEIVLSQDKVSLRKVAESCFVLTLQRLVPDLVPDAMEKLNVNTSFAQKVQQRYRGLLEVYK